MTLKSLRRILLATLFTSLSAATTAGVAHAQLPFGDLTPTEDAEPGQIGVEQEGPMRPIDRPPIDPNGIPTRPSDDEFGLDDPIQSVSVKERFAGWQQAGDLDGNRLSDTLRANWVMLDRNGQFTGTVRGIDGAEVAGMTIFLMNNGRLVKTAAVQENGSFVFTNVQRGAYAFVGWGDKAFFAFGANIINKNDDADPSTPTSVNCYAFQNETTINTDWIRYYAPNIAYRVFGRYSVGEGADDPDQLMGFEGLTANPVPAEVSTSIGGTPVALDSRGRLIGRVHQMNSINGRPVDLRSTKVMLLKGDSVVTSTTTDNFGVFQFEGIQTGGYGLVAVGVDGVGSIGVQVIDHDATVLDAEGIARVGGGKVSPIDFTMVSAETVGWLNHYASEVAYRQAVLRPRPTPPARNQYNDPIPNPRDKNSGRSAICSSPCLTYEQWVANGCACQKTPPIWQAVGERIRNEVERLDNRFEEAFYGSDFSGSGYDSRNLNAPGYYNSDNGYYNNGGGYVPVPNVAPPAPGVAPPGQGVTPAVPLPQIIQPPETGPVARRLQDNRR